MTGLKEATKNKQKTLPLNVEYEHLSETIQNLEENKEGSQGNFVKKLKPFFPVPVTLESLRRDKVEIATKYRIG